MSVESPVSIPTSDPAPVHPPARSRAGAAALALLVLVGAALRVWGLGHQGFWYDEADSALLMHFSFGDMLGLLPHTESTPPLYYMLAWGWSQIIPPHEAGLRALSALAGTLTIPVVALAARRLAGSVRAGLVAGALAALNPLLIWYSQEARAYALLVLLCALAWLSFAAALERPGARSLLAWALCGAAALCTHYYAVIVIIPQGLALLWVHRRPLTLLALALVAAAGGGLLPMLITQNGTGNAHWIQHRPLGLRVGQVLPEFLLGTGVPDPETLKWVAFALALVLLGGLVLLRPPRGLLVVGLTLAGFALALLFSLVGFDSLITRNVIGLWPGAAIGVAVGVGAAFESGGLADLEARARRAGRLVRAGGALGLGGLCALGVLAVGAVHATPALQRPDWRPLAAMLAREAPPAGEGRLIVIQHYRQSLPLALYLPRLGYGHRPEYHNIGQIDVIALSHAPRGNFCWWGAGCNLVPTTLQSRYAIPGFQITRVWRRRPFTVALMVARRPRDVAVAAVAAALTETTLQRDALLLQRGRVPRSHPA